MLLLFLPTSHGIEALAVLDRRLSIQRSNFNITRERINGESSYQITLRFSGFYFSPHCLHASLTPRFMSFSLLYVIGPLLIFFVKSVFLSSPHTTTFPLSRFISHSFSHSLHWPQPFPTQSLFLDLSPRLSPPDGIPASEVIIRHSAKANDFPQPCLSTRARIGAAATIVSSQVYS